MEYYYAAFNAELLSDFKEPQPLEFYGHFYNENKRRLNLYPNYLVIDPKAGSNIRSVNVIETEIKELTHFKVLKKIN